jgi:hypothetical protein
MAELIGDAELRIDDKPIKIVQLTLSIDTNTWATMTTEKKSEYAIALVDGALGERETLTGQLQSLQDEEAQAYRDLQTEYNQKRREIELKYAALKNELM